MIMSRLEAGGPEDHDGRPGAHSAVAPDCLMIGSQNAWSSSITLRAAAGEIGGSISKPWTRSLSLTCGFWLMRLISVLKRWTTAAGVPAGTAKPSHTATTKSGTPASFIVDTSGNRGERSLAVKASALSLPALIWPSTVGALKKPVVTSPLTTARTAAGAPR